MKKEEVPYMPTAIINGFDHYYEDAGSGEVLVMLHGAAGSSKGLAVHIPELAKDFRVLIPDMRGMGRSAHVPSIPPSAWVDDVRGLLDHLGIDQAHVYGSSLGMRVALRFAIDHPDCVKSLLLASSIIANEPAGNAALNRGYVQISPERAEGHRINHGDDWEAVVKNYSNIRNEPNLQEYYNLRELCKQVQAPALLMRGDIDEPVHPLGHSFELHSKLPNSHLAILPTYQTGAPGILPEMLYLLIREFVTNLSAVPAG
jgi:pimeloyl-ACP methyl ester carboxylesterase